MMMITIDGGEAAGAHAAASKATPRADHAPNDTLHRLVEENLKISPFATALRATTASAGC
jgi:hypothetical protein